MLLKSFLLFAAISSASIALAQDYTSTNAKAIKAYEGAATAFNGRSYELAIAYLDEAIDKDPDFVEAYLMKFEVYAEQDDLVNAEYSLEEAVEVNPDFYRNAWYFLGELEMSQGKYIEAGPHYTKFLSYENLNPEMVFRSRLQIANCDFAIVAKQNPVNFQPLNMGEAINSEFAEYYPTLSADESSLIYTRLVNDPRAYGGKQEEFYQSTNRDGTWFPSVPLMSVNTELNEGAPSLSADGRFLVFTACELLGDYGEGRSGFGSCDLFISENIGGKWQKPKNLGEPINSKYWETQPSLSADGNVLYFIRGLPTKSGVKDQDIFTSWKRADGSWTKPQKLTSMINTPYKEESVQIHPDGKTLYFSSEGHPGMGGLDLFVSRKNRKGEWQTPVNLGYPINTYGEENSLLVSPNGQIAYFASNRAGGFGSLDLYQFPLYESVQPIAVATAKGRVTDALTKEPVKAEIYITDLNNRNFKKEFKSDPETGQFMLSLNAGDEYAATVTAPGYLFHSENFTVPEAGDFKGYALDVELSKIKEGSSIVMKNIFFATDSDTLTEHSVPELRKLGEFLEANPNVTVEISGYTDNTGDSAYNLDLSERRANAVRNYIVQRRDIEATQVTAKGYGAENPVASNDTEAGRAENRRTEVKITSAL